MPHDNVEIDEFWLRHWCAEGDGDAAAARQECRQRLAAVACSLAARCVTRPLAADDPRLTGYAERLFRCVLEHARAGNLDRSWSLSMAVERLRAWQPQATRPAVDLLGDVALAEAMQQLESPAMERFVREYQPLIERVARRCSGETGVQATADLASRLVVSERDDRPPKIARYHGRAPLAAWLETVVVNDCITHHRRRDHRTPRHDVENLAIVSPTADSTSDGDGHCRQLLAPMMAKAVQSVSAEGQAMLKLLYLDGVKQADVARTLGIHTGNVGRRRKDLEDSVWESLGREAQSFFGTDVEPAEKQRRRRCWRRLLVGEDRELERALAQVLGAAIAGNSSHEGETDERP